MRAPCQRTLQLGHKSRMGPQDLFRKTQEGQTREKHRSLWKAPEWGGSGKEGQRAQGNNQGTQAKHLDWAISVVGGPMDQEAGALLTCWVARSSLPPSPGLTPPHLRVGRRGP